MNKDIKNKWVKALRSGKYKQGAGCLKTAQGRYCCLGVLCEVVGAVIIDPLVFGDSWLNATYKGNSKMEGLLPGGLRKDIDMAPGYPNKLANMNDNGDTFEEIADYIEENL